jgi:CDP-glucose 4,6-dehydratase
MNKLRNFFKNKRVLLTGHTGFKGSWMSVFLSEVGAIVQGYANDPKNIDDLFLKASIKDYVNDFRGDILDTYQLETTIADFSPEIVFHFAAQALVIDSYKDPRATWEVNVMGTMNLLECLRESNSVKSIVIITTDKVYKNVDKVNEYMEDDTLGGYDPYSSSKAAVEILVASMNDSFYKSKMVGLATARSGNVIGGGDWSDNRLIPDYYRAVFDDSPFELRNPKHIRPWQHVLDVLHGYCILAMRLYEDPLKYSKAWNFGPSNSFITTKEIIDRLNSRRKIQIIDNKINTNRQHETQTLRLSSAMSNEFLLWRNHLSLEESLDMIEDIYINYFDSNLQNILKKQVKDYLVNMELK